MALLALDKRLFNLSELMDYTGISLVSTGKHLKILQKKGYCQLIYQNFGSELNCYSLVWIKRSLDDRPLTINNLTARKVKYRVSHPNFGVFQITSGNIRRFARKHNLDYRGFRAVLSGDRNTHKGWKLDKKQHQTIASSLSHR
jgi:hypothetical protein